jgi:zinc transporter, ZIP family
VRRSRLHADRHSAQESESVNRSPAMFESVHLQAGLIAALVVGFSNFVGAAFLLPFRTLSARVTSALIGFSGGVMLAACSLSLIPSAFEELAGVGTPVTNLALVLPGIALGAFLIFAMDFFLPHEHPVRGKEGIVHLAASRAWLIVLAVAIHNFPEGFAVGMGYGIEDIWKGHTITTAIVFRDLPEGLIAATALLAAGYSRWRAFGVAFATGFVETAGALVGLAAAGINHLIVPFGLSFGAGAMIYVTAHEVIPESFRRGHERSATWGFLLGFMLMLSLNYLFH